MVKYIFCLLIISMILSPAGSSKALIAFDFEQPYFREPGVVVKDHSLVREGSTYHLFYLRGNPAVNLGHATSEDLVHWNIEAPVLLVQPGTWDGYAIWAPDIILTPQDYYFMYYTGVNNSGSQQTGLAFASDLYSWTKLTWPVYHPDPSWALWSETEWCHGRDPFVFEHNGTRYLLNTAMTNSNLGAIASATSNDYFTWQDNGPIYVHNSWHVLESVQCIYKNSKFHLFFTEEEVYGTSYMNSDSLYSGWDIGTRTIIDLGQAAEIDWFDDAYLFSRHTAYMNEYGELSYVIRFDPLNWIGEVPLMQKPWPLAQDWNLIYGIAFAFQPTFGNNPAIRGDTVDVGFEGDCWISTYERYQGPLMYGSPGGAQGDGATGMIRSNPFVITGNSMNLLVGGGYYPDACYVALVESGTGTVLFKETGENTNAMSRRYWDLTPHKQKTVYFEIADLSNSSFGHICVDDIRESDEIINPDPPPVDRSKTKSRPDTSSPDKEKATDIARIELYQNAPNPFNPATTITYYLPKASFVTLEVFDVGGAFVRRLVGEHQSEGMRQAMWDGRSDTGASVSSGIYFYRLTADGKVIGTKKMALLK
jgi:hypothetical protein